MANGEAPASVLDASALLALLQNEPGASSVVEAIGAGAAISAVNFSEVLAKLAERGEQVSSAVAAIKRAIEHTHGGLQIEAFTEENGIEAARFEVGAVTTDRAWAALPEVVAAVKLIR